MQGRIGQTQLKGVRNENTLCRTTRQKMLGMLVPRLPGRSFLTACVEVFPLAPRLLEDRTLREAYRFGGCAMSNERQIFWM